MKKLNKKEHPRNGRVRIIKKGTTKPILYYMPTQEEAIKLLDEQAMKKLKWVWRKYES